MNASKTSLILALTSVIGTAGIAHAAGNPFAMQSLDSGYQVAAADDKAMEGKCGGDKTKAQAKSKVKAKSKDGKCGEGKCGASKAKATEGKCGGDKTKPMEGKCGGSK
jgi:uncharacterized low-complexity protein